MTCNIFVKDSEVIPQLTQMRLPKNVMLNILERTIGERRNVTENDPITTSGTETWRWGTRFCRDDNDLKELGWISCKHNQIEGIRNDELKIKLVVVNTDSYTGISSKSPRNNAGKGPSAVKLVENNSNQITFEFIDTTNEHPIDKYDFFYFCIHASKNYISAEISRPDKIISQTIRSFSDRIMICKPGEMDGLDSHKIVPEDFAEIEKPVITRKR